MTVAKTILINGASSSGKTSLCRALKTHLEIDTYHANLDVYLNSFSFRSNNYGLLNDSTLFRMIKGFLKSAATIASEDFVVIIDMVVQEAEWISPILDSFASSDLYLVGLDCALSTLRIRENMRPDRIRGIAEYQIHRVHRHMIYDLFLDSSVLTAEAMAYEVTNLIRLHQPAAFQKMLESRDRVSK